MDSSVSLYWLLFFCRQSTVVFHSIRQGLWRVTALPKFLFRHFQNLAVTRPKIRRYCAAGRKILLCWASDHQTVSALKKNLCYKRYISAILEAAWRVTAELNEILQYCSKECQRRAWVLHKPACKSGAQEQLLSSQQSISEMHHLREAWAAQCIDDTALHNSC